MVELIHKVGLPAHLRTSRLGYFCIGMFVYAVSGATADLAWHADKLDPADGIPMPPPNLAIIDVGVEIDATDYFFSEGIRATLPTGGRLLYAYDENGNVLSTAPGSNSRFVTFASKPRQRNADGRFGAGAGIGVQGRWCTFGEIPWFFDNQIEASWAGPDTVLGRDGYVMRIAIDLSQVQDERFRVDSDNIVVATQQPQDSIVIFETNCSQHDGGFYVYSNIDNNWGNFGVYGVIPEPSTLSLLLISSIACRFVGRRSLRARIFDEITLRTGRPHSPYQSVD